MINIQKNYSVHIGSIRSTLVHSAHFGSIWSTLVLFGPYWSNLCTWFHLVDIGPIQSYLFLLSPHWSNLSYSIHFGPPYSHSVLFCPLSPLWSICVHFDPFRPLHFTLVHFGPFLYTCIQGKHMFRLRALILNTNFIYLLLLLLYIKLVISKILSIAFIITKLLLSHINIAF